MHESNTAKKNGGGGGTLNPSISRWCGLSLHPLQLFYESSQRSPAYYRRLRFIVGLVFLFFEPVHFSFEASLEYIFLHDVSLFYTLKQLDLHASF